MAAVVYPSKDVGLAFAAQMQRQHCGEVTSVRRSYIPAESCGCFLNVSAARARCSLASLNSCVSDSYSSFKDAPLFSWFS